MVYNTTFSNPSYLSILFPASKELTKQNWVSGQTCGLSDPRHTRQGREGFINLLQFNNLQQVPDSGQQLYGAQSEQDNGYYIHSRAKRSDESDEEYRVSLLLL